MHGILYHFSTASGLSMVRLCGRRMKTVLEYSPVDVPLFTTSRQVLLYSCIDADSDGHSPAVTESEKTRLARSSRSKVDGKTPLKGSTKRRKTSTKRTRFDAAKEYSANMPVADLEGERELLC